jgi:signal transduction histidine kinase
MSSLEKPGDGIKILMIEDNRGDQILTQKKLSSASWGSPLQFFSAFSIEEGKNILRSREIDIILLDLHLPDSAGLDSVKQIKTLFPRIGLIVLTGWNDRQLAIESLQVGAQDYLIKGSYQSQSLAWSIRSAITRQEKLNHIESLNSTEKKKAEFKDEVLSMAAHDIRGSLVGVLGFLQKIILGEFIDDLKPEQKRIFELMLRNCESVICLSDEIVRARREQSVQITPNIEDVNIHHFVESLIEEVRSAADEKDIEIDFQITMEDPLLRFDPSLFARALKNLLFNAIKYSPRKTKVCLSVKAEAPDQLCFLVTDSGPGIESSKLANLFDEERSFDNLELSHLYNGLGLVIVKRIVSAHGGRISVKASPEKGTQFLIRIPRLLGWKNSTDQL